MDKAVLAVPALILIVIGALITGSAFTSGSQKSFSMPGNFDNLALRNTNGYDQSGFPAYYGSGQRNIILHVDITPYAGSGYQVQILWKILSGDWSKTIAQGTLPYQGKAQDYTFQANLDFGTYVMVIYVGDKALYWQHFSVINPQGSLILGGVSIFVGGVFLIYAVKPGRYR